MDLKFRFDGRLFEARRSGRRKPSPSPRFSFLPLGVHAGRWRDLVGSFLFRTVFVPFLSQAMYTLAASMSVCDDAGNFEEGRKEAAACHEVLRKAPTVQVSHEGINKTDCR